MKLIDKDALIAEIERRLKFVENRLKRNNSYTEEGNIAWERDKALYDSYDQILSFINTLEVKEVDLDFQRFAKEMDAIFALPSSETKNTEEEPLNWEYAIAKHFFELGMRVNNLITAADRGVAEEIIINLKRVEKDYRINLTKEIEWVRNQVKKGE